MNPSDDESFHALSLETLDPWELISTLVRSIWFIDGDHEDVRRLDSSSRDGTPSRPGH